MLCAQTLTFGGVANQDQRNAIASLPDEEKIVMDPLNGKVFSTPCGPHCLSVRCLFVCISVALACRYERVEGSNSSVQQCTQAEREGTESCITQA